MAVLAIDQRNVEATWGPRIITATVFAETVALLAARNSEVKFACISLILKIKNKVAFSVICFEILDCA